MDTKSEYETACIALNTLKENETDALKAEIEDVQNEISKNKKYIQDKEFELKKLNEENRKLSDDNHFYEIEYAKKSKNIQDESEKIIKSPMKKINEAKELRAENAKLENDLKNIIDLDIKLGKVSTKYKEIREDILPQFSKEVGRKFSLNSLYFFVKF